MKSTHTLGAIIATFITLCMTSACAPEALTADPIGADGAEDMGAVADTGSTLDAGTQDAGAQDSGMPPTDAGGDDAGTADTGGDEDAGPTISNIFEPDDAAAIAAGEMLYGNGCVICHGDSGGGGIGSSLMMTKSRSDEYLFTMIQRGYNIETMTDQNNMPAYGAGFNETEAYSDEQIWQLITYLQTFDTSN